MSRVLFIRNYIRDPVRIFSISPLVKISVKTKSLENQFCVFVSLCLYNKKKITRWLEDMSFIFSCQEQYFTHSPELVRKILFLPLENKTHIFAPPCNILYICGFLLYILIFCRYCHVMFNFYSR